MHKQAAQPVQDNSWYERGDLPPAGCECRCNLGGGSVFIVARHHFIDAVVYSSAPGGGELLYGYAGEFSPLRTERENSIDELNELVGDIEKYPTWRDAIAGIIDAGYRKMDSK